MQLLLVTLLFLGKITTNAQTLEEIRAARTQQIAPKQELPEWADWKKISDGLAFSLKHRGRIGYMWGTTGLFETLGVADAGPMFAATGAIEKDAQRGMRTAAEFGVMISKQETMEAFRQTNFAKARALGAMHLAMTQAEFTKKLGWDPKLRLPFNQQAYGMIVHTFSYRPVEVMLRQGQIQLETDKAGIEGWLHLWSVLAYGMGLDVMKLGPLDYDSAQRRDKMLRAEQFVASDGTVTQPILRAELTRSKQRLMKRDSSISEDKARATAVDTMLAQIRLAGGLDGALGLADGTAREKMLSWSF